MPFAFGNDVAIAQTLNPEAMVFIVEWPGLALTEIACQGQRNCVFTIYHKGTNPVEGSACVVLVAKARGWRLKAAERAW